MQKIQWRLEKRKISDLNPHPKNPRQLSQDQAIHLRKSIEKYGVIDRPIITQDNLIIGGHQRLKIMRTLGIEDIECWIPSRELDENEIDELNIRLNHGASWNWDILANEYQEEDLLKWGFKEEDLFGRDGFDEEEEKEKKEEHKQKCPTCGKKMKKNDG